MATYVANSSKYLVAAKAALMFTKKSLDIGAANKVAPWDFYGKVAAGLCAGTALGKGELMEKVDSEMNDYRKNNPGAGLANYYAEYVDVMASWAKHYGCGNCGPHSALAFVHLRDVLKMLPLDWFMYNDFQHAFVIVGRSASTEPLDFTTWNKDAAICDPWRGEAELVFPYASMRFTGRKLVLLTRAE